MTVLDQGTVDYYRSWLAYRQWYLRVPGVQVAAAEHGEPVLSAAFGSADLDTGERLTERHLFRIASHSKSFAAVAVLQLLEQGKLRLDDPVGSRLPDLAGSGLAAVTIGELLAHGGGVIRDSVDGDFWQLWREFPDRDTLLAIAALPSAAVLARNDRFKYSNIGYGLLGLVIEEVTGRSFGEQLATAVVDRLGLKDCGADLNEARLADLAAGHSALSTGRQRQVLSHVNTGALAAATGCYATAADLVAFYTALLPGQDALLGADALRLMRHRLWDMKGADSGYGLGLMLGRIGEREVFGHSGGYPGHITRTFGCAETGLVVSVLTNAIDGPAEPLAAGLFRLLDLAKSASHQPADDPERFVGRFSLLWGVQDVASIGGRLFLLNPTVVNPAEDPTPLEVVDRSTLRIVGGSGGGAYGEPLSYEFADDGSIRTVRGESGLTMTPFELPSF
ncbi:MAG TPA: serine hydrolase domain-containing protein [Jatrophihabitans sp.]|nr:serine hydrolase domain-containing protein [Jatrophihabitans sp.]